MTYREAVQIVRILLTTADPMLGPSERSLRAQALAVLERTYVEPDDQEATRGPDLPGQRV